MKVSKNKRLSTYGISSFVSSEEQNSFLATFGKRIQELRLEKGLTQEELNEMCCYKPDFIKHLEQGEINMGIRTVVNIAYSLDTTIADIFESITIDR